MDVGGVGVVSAPLQNVAMSSSRVTLAQRTELAVAAEGRALSTNLLPSRRPITECFCGELQIASRTVLPEEAST